MTLRRMLAGLLALIPSLGLAGCGTGAFTSTYRATVDDPAALLGSGSIRLSIFDIAGGDTRDWAERSLGTASSGKPYITTISTVETRTAFDGGPPDRVRAGLYLPDYRRLGWYSLDLQPNDGTEMQVDAPFVAWDGYGPQAKGVPPLTVMVRATASGDSWDLAVTIRLAVERPDEERAGASADPLTQQLIIAAANGDQTEVERLLIKGAEINGADSSGRTPVIAAAYANQVEVVRYLVQYGADVNLKDNSGQSAYLISTSEVGPGDALLVVMLNGGARTSAADSAGDTGLIRAARRGYVSVMRRLLLNGEPINQVNNSGRTALHESLIVAKCTSDHIEGIDLLIRNGADVNLAMREGGKRPLDLARDTGCQGIIGIIEGAAAKTLGG